MKRKYFGEGIDRNYWPRKRVYPCLLGWLLLAAAAGGAFTLGSCASGGASGESSPAAEGRGAAGDTPARGAGETGAGAVGGGIDREGAVLWQGEGAARAWVEAALPAGRALVDVGSREEAAGSRAASWVQGLPGLGLEQDAVPGAGEPPAGWLPEEASSWEYPALVRGLVERAQGLPEYRGFYPVEWSAWGFFYNREVFSQLGIQEPETWKQFTDALEVLRIRGYAPVTAAGAGDGGASAWFYYLSLRLGGAERHQRLMEGDLSFSSSHVRLVMNHWRHLIVTYFDRYAGELSPREAWEKIADKKAGIILAESSQLGLLSPSQRGQIGFFPFPDKAGGGAEEASVFSLGRGVRVLSRSGDGGGDGALSPLGGAAFWGELLAQARTGRGESLSAAALLPVLSGGPGLEPEVAASKGFAELFGDWQSLAEEPGAAAHLPGLALSREASEGLAGICRAYLQRRFQVQSELARLDGLR